jgi:hypothetical protein
VYEVRPPSPRIQVHGRFLTLRIRQCQIAYPCSRSSKSGIRNRCEEAEHNFNFIFQLTPSSPESHSMSIQTRHTTCQLSVGIPDCYPSDLRRWQISAASSSFLWTTEGWRVPLAKPPRQRVALRLCQWIKNLPAICPVTKEKLSNVNSPCHRRRLHISCYIDMQQRLTSLFSLSVRSVQFLVEQSCY